MKNKQVLDEKARKEIRARVEFSKQMVSELIEASWDIHFSFRKKGLFVSPITVFESVKLISAGLVADYNEGDVQ